jgi:hypothetical protein
MNVAPTDRGPVPGSDPAPTLAPPCRVAAWPRLAALFVYGTLLAGAVGLWLVYVATHSGLAEYAARCDFIALYIGARAVVIGQGTHLYDLAVQQRIAAEALAPYTTNFLLPFIYPGFAALIFAPLGALDYPTAFLVWEVLNLALAGWSLWRLIQIARPASADRLPPWLAAAGFVPLLITLALGQFSILSLVALTGAFAALRARKEGQAGLWLLLSLIKPQLVLLPLLVLLLGRRWRALAVYAAGMAVLVGGSILVLGNWIPDELGFWERIGPAVGTGVMDVMPWMHNWRGLVWGLLDSTTSPLALGLTGGLTVVSLAVLVGFCWPRGAAAPQPFSANQWALAILVSLLAIPHLHHYDLTIALVPALVLWRTSSQVPPEARPRSVQVLRGLLIGGPVTAWISWVAPPSRSTLVPGTWPSGWSSSAGPGPHSAAPRPHPPQSLRLRCGCRLRDDPSLRIGFSFTPTVRSR